MRNFLIIALLALASSMARAQDPTEAEKEVLSGIARCLLVGLPQDWYQAQVIVELETPGAPGGEVRYLVSRSLSRDQFEPFKPCDERSPANALVEMRSMQPPERRGWKTARFVLARDGKFDLTHDYPK